MSNLCECGHPATEHEMNWGRCAGECIDFEYGRFACLCHHFDRDTDT